ncbi:MAG TPA: MlrC C-terminal domain-containing protein, partial [Planctomycetaceae bacterium]|nr:MlrC C-terminal domain-containing protein [Planctomycetaceae bacterium]
VRFIGTVERLLEIEFILDGHISRNLPIRMGRAAVVSAGGPPAAPAVSPDDGRRQAARGHGPVTVLLVERTGPGSTPRLYESAGLDPRQFGIVVAKSPAGFRADYAPFAAEILLADCPGCASPDWPRLNFARVTRPLWPLDPLEHAEHGRWCHTARASL